MILAAHMALRYLPTAHDVPFWALSGIAAAESEVGGEQPLRGFGVGRFYDRDSFAGSLELRRKVPDLRYQLDEYRRGIDSLHRCRRCSRERARFLWISSTMSTVWDSAGSRAPSWWATWISATAARALPPSTGLNYPF